MWICVPNTSIRMRVERDGFVLAMIGDRIISASYSPWIIDLMKLYPKYEKALKELDAT